ncbi:MAG: DUF349 domain-containing protein [Muribaculum sp.]|nr:DUF349 domain-containing protein [Muribaculum sp.]
MNENEKMELNEEQTSAQPLQECSGTPNEPADAASVCSEPTSPSMDLAAAADAASPALEQEEAAALKKINELHSLSKEELVGKIKEILANDNMQAHKDVTLMKQAFFNIRKRESDEEMKAWVEGGNDIAAFAVTPCELETEFKALYDEFKQKRAAFLEKEEEVRQENLAKKFRAIEGIKALAEDVDNINRNFQEFQRLQQEFKEIKDVPQQAETEVWKQYQSAVEEFYDLLKLNKELRDLDFKKNLEAKRELIEETKRLAEVSDAIAASRRLQEIHNTWREIGPVAKDLRESLWEEFKAASSVVNRRHQEFFEQRKANELKNEEAKVKLCERMEAIDTEVLKTFSDWDKATEEVKALQAEWRTLGYATRKANNALFSRFRESIDKFFEKKSTFYQAIRDQFKENMEKKTDLCERAEALANIEIVNDALKEAKALQEEWKTVGSVDRRQSDMIWRRFMNAINAVYDRRKQLTESRKGEEKANLEKKTRIIADLKAIYEETEETGDSINRMRALQDEWRATGFVPMSKKQELNDQYYELVRSLSDKLLGGRRGGHRRDNQKRTGGRELSPREQLLNRIAVKKADLQTYENNLGFFNVKSAAGNSMVKEMQNKIDKIKKEIEGLQTELREMDSKEEQA